MKKLPTSQLILFFLLFALMSVLGLLAGLEVPNYLEVTNELKLHQITAILWIWISILMVTYAVVGIFSSILTTRAAGELLDRFGWK